MPKPRLGLFSFSCCEGCTFELADLEENFLKALNFLDLIQSRAYLEKSSSMKLDIALVDGAITTKAQEKELREIRARTNYLIAFGSCACLGGVPAMRNSLPEELQQKILSARKNYSSKVKAVEDIVKIDFKVKGCPATLQELETVLNDLIHGLTPKETDFPVCLECKQKENNCFLLQGKDCLGSIAFGGCQAICPSNGFKCLGCRGFTKDANTDSLKDKLKENGFSVKDINELLLFYNSRRKENA